MTTALWTMVNLMGIWIVIRMRRDRHRREAAERRARELKAVLDAAPPVFTNAQIRQCLTKEEYNQIAVDLAKRQTHPRPFTAADYINSRVQSFEPRINEMTDCRHILSDEEFLRRQDWMVAMYNEDAVAAKVTCSHEWREPEYIRSDGSGFDRCRICGRRRERAERAVLADLTDAELNTFDAVTSQYLEQDSELRKDWGVLPRIIAELQRRRGEA